MDYLVSPCRTVKSNLNGIPIVGGQWIVVTDTYQLYCDISETTRIEITNIKILSTEEDRLGILAPITMFYFVLSSKMLWFYNSGWIPVGVSKADQISFTPPSGVSAELNTVQLALSEIFNKKISCSSSSVLANSIVVFDSTTGNSVTSTNLKIIGDVITGLQDPTNESDAATKKYVDSKKPYIMQDTEPSDHSILWIKSSNKVIHYYDDTSSEWVPIRGVTG